MDFTNRSNQQSPAAPRPGSAFPADSSDASHTRSNSSRSPKGFGRNWSRLGGTFVVVAATVLLVAILALLFTTKQSNEASLIKTNQLQAVFLTNDQVYFGQIKDINSKYMVLDDIYYLQTSSNSADNKTADGNVSLVKLGCELHKPFDTMVLNRGEVQFWENLQPDGQVAKAVKQFQEQNPKGQTCSTNTNANSTNVQGSTQPDNNSATPETVPNKQQ
jgi:hypothetical protein